MVRHLVVILTLESVYLAESVHPCGSPQAFCVTLLMRPFNSGGFENDLCVAMVYTVSVGILVGGVVECLVL